MNEEQPVYWQKQMVEILELLRRNLQGIHVSLDRIADSLEKIEKNGLPR